MKSDLLYLKYLFSDIAKSGLLKSKSFLATKGEKHLKTVFI